jgi:hypothetical protein
VAGGRGGIVKVRCDICFATTIARAFPPSNFLQHISITSATDVSATPFSSQAPGIKTLFHPSKFIAGASNDFLGILRVSATRLGAA